MKVLVGVVLAVLVLAPLAAVAARGLRRAGWTDAQVDDAGRSTLQNLVEGLIVLAVVVIGGLGSMAGTVLGALIFGLLRSFGILFVPQFETLFIFLLMAVVLIVRPQGLLGRRVVSGH